MPVVTGDPAGQAPHRSEGVRTFPASKILVKPRVMVIGPLKCKAALQSLTCQSDPWLVLPPAGAAKPWLLAQWAKQTQRLVLTVLRGPLGQVTSESGGTAGGWDRLPYRVSSVRVEF